VACDVPPESPRLPLDELPELLSLLAGAEPDDEPKEAQPEKQNTTKNNASIFFITITSKTANHSGGIATFAVPDYDDGNIVAKFYSNGSTG
jgi:hypothetical protein